MAAAGLRPLGQVREPGGREHNKRVSGSSADETAEIRTIEDGVATVQTHLVLKPVHALRTVAIL